jgi:hypothetical protein
MAHTQWIHLAIAVQFSDPKARWPAPPLCAGDFQFLHVREL